MLHEESFEKIEQVLKEKFKNEKIEKSPILYAFIKNILFPSVFIFIFFYIFYFIEKKDFLNFWCAILALSFVLLFCYDYFSYSVLEKVEDFKENNSVIDMLFLIKDKISNEEYKELYELIESKNWFDLSYSNFQEKFLKECYKTENKAKQMMKKMSLDAAYEEIKNK